MKIDKNIPIPDKDYRASNPKWPWNKMEIGDSIAIPIDKNTGIPNKNLHAGRLCKKTVAVKSYFAQISRSHPEYKFCYRIVRMPTEEENYALRIWRIEVPKKEKK